MLAIKGQVHQICLDHFGFNSVYTTGIAEWKIPFLPSHYTKTGAIYIGLAVHLFLHLLEHESYLEEYFVTSLADKTNKLENDVV